MKQTDALISKFYSGTELYMFRVVSLSFLRCYPLYIQHWHMLYMFDDILILNASCRQKCIACASAEFTVDNS